MRVQYKIVLFVLTLPGTALRISTVVGVCNAAVEGRARATLHGKLGFLRSAAATRLQYCTVCVCALRAFFVCCVCCALSQSMKVVVEARVP